MTLGRSVVLGGMHMFEPRIYIRHLPNRTKYDSNSGYEFAPEGLVVEFNSKSLTVEDVTSSCALSIRAGSTLTIPEGASKAIHTCTITYVRDGVTYTAKFNVTAISGALRPFEAVDNAWVSSAGTLLHTSGNYVKANDGDAVFLIDYDSNGWVCIIGVGLTESAAMFTYDMTTYTSSFSDIIDGVTLYFVRGAVSSYTKDNPQNLPVVSGENLFTVNYAISRSEAVQICNLLGMDA